MVWVSQQEPTVQGEQMGVVSHKPSNAEIWITTVKGKGKKKTATSKNNNELFATSLEEWFRYIWNNSY